MREVYLDYNGSAPLDPRVAAAMVPVLTDGVGNASSTHRFGRRQTALVDEAREHVAELAARADIVFENFGPGGAGRCGLGWEAIHAREPRTTWVAISPWGGSGPWADRPCTEFTLQAATGSTANRA